jgi:exonuclease 3'-5' domain-containing protein 1
VRKGAADGAASSAAVRAGADANANAAADAAADAADADAADAANAGAPAASANKRAAARMRKRLRQPDAADAAAPAPVRKRSKAAEPCEFTAALDARTVVIGAPGAAFAAALAAIAASPVVAIDAEGVQMSRTGQLTLLQVATDSSVFLFDILALGPAAFDELPPAAAAAAVEPAAPVTAPSLRRVLEDAARTKLVWDVRRDSDALMHQHRVSLRGVLDVQLAAVAVRRAAGETVATLPGMPQTVKRFLDKVRLRLRLRLRAHALLTVRVPLTAQAATRACWALKSGVRHDEGDGLWAQRPMSLDTQRYAAADAMLTHMLHAALAPALAMDGLLLRVQRASDARVCEWRDLAEAVPQLRCAAHSVAPDV